MTHCTDVGGTENATVNVSQYRGDTMRLVVELGAKDQQPVDVSEWSFICQLRDAADAIVTDIAVDMADASIGVVELLIDELPPPWRSRTTSSTSTATTAPTPGRCSTASSGSRPT